MKKVLTVDDSKVVRTMVTKHLQPWGCTIVEAANGQEGVELARREQPDLILLDVTMPVMDGRQALAEIRKDDTTKDIAVVMLTAESGKELVLEIVKLGVKGYIVKPFTRETFEKEVAKIIGAPGEQAAAPAPPPAAAPAAVDPSTVLVVDDSARVLEAAKSGLGGAFTVLTALSGKEALEQYAQARPGVVVIDLLMPEMDGVQTLARLRANGGAGSAYVALSVRGDAGAHEKARKAGFRAILDKPFQPAEIVEQVKAVLATAASDGDPILATQNGCPIIVVPDPKSKAFPRFLKAAQSAVRSLAEEGHDCLVVDLLAITEMNVGLTKTLVELMSEASGKGIRTAVCAASSVTDGLKQLAETREAAYADSRDAAIESLRR